MAMRLARLGTLLLLLLPACADLGRGPDVLGVDGGVGFIDGAGPPPEADAAIDAGAMIPTGPEDPTTAGSCYDGEDNDRDDLLDCADDACGADAVCCVGSSACCAPATSLAFSVPAACRDADLASCAELDSAIRAFGAVAPDFEAGGLVPQGGASYGGIALGGAVDPRGENLDLSATVVVPTGRCTDCVDAAGIGFIESLPAAGERAVVRLGVLLNGSRQEAQIIVADRPIDAVPLSEGSHALRILVDIDGRAILSGIYDEDRALDDLDLPGTLIPVVFGRTDNRAGEPAVHVTEASLSRSPCDVPSALARTADPLLPASSSTWTPSTLGRVAVTETGPTDAPRTRIVFAHGGDLLAVGPNGIGELVGTSGPPDTLLAPPPEYETIHDPFVVEDGDSLVLYFAGERPDHKRDLMRAVGAGGRALSFSPPELVEVPSDVASIDGPTVWIEDLAAGRWRMIARVDDGSGARLAALVSTDSGGRFDWANGTLAASVVLAPRTDDVFAIDRDEVADPALLVVGGTWRLYYAARRGQRWSIGLLLSTDGTAWRSMGPVLEGDGEGFDGLGVRSPAPWLEGTSVRMYYVGTNGSEDAVGMAGPAGTVGE